MTNRTVRNRQTGFTLVEALVALCIVGFGMLALVAVQFNLNSGTDLTRQRAEAMRLAQEKIEYFRSYTGITTGTINWDALASSATEEIIDKYTIGGVDVPTNATYRRTWSLSGNNNDAVRMLQVKVTWEDRNYKLNSADADKGRQSVVLHTSIARVDPLEAAYLGYPLPQNTNLKRPKNRNLNIPLEAIQLNSQESAYVLSSTLQIVFSNTSGLVIKKCANLNATGSNYATATCTDFLGYVLAGYISGTPTVATGVNLQSITGITGSACKFGDAEDINTKTPIAGYKYYVCVLQVAALGNPYAGTVKLGGIPTGSGNTYKVCRFQYAASDFVDSNERNVQPYSGVAKSLDNQNYYIENSASGSCPTITSAGAPSGFTGASVATQMHQDCRASQSPTTTATGTCPATAHNAATSLP